MQLQLPFPSWLPQPWPKTWATTQEFRLAVRFALQSICVRSFLQSNLGFFFIFLARKHLKILSLCLRLSGFGLKGIVFLRADRQYQISCRYLSLGQSLYLLHIVKQDGWYHLGRNKSALLWSKGHYHILEPEALSLYFRLHLDFLSRPCILDIFKTNSFLIL